MAPAGTPFFRTDVMDTCKVKLLERILPRLLLPRSPTLPFELRIRIYNAKDPIWRHPEELHLTFRKIQARALFSLAGVDILKSSHGPSASNVQKISKQP